MLRPTLFWVTLAILSGLLCGCLGGGDHGTNHDDHGAYHDDQGDQHSDQGGPHNDQGGPQDDHH